MHLQNKVALITGGTSGIGKATVELFATEGAQVVFTGRRVDKGRTLQSLISNSLFVEADHRQLIDCEKAVQETLAAFGRIDVLFNNAGIVLGGTAESTTESDWAEILDVNVTAVWRMSRLVIPVMRQHGGGVIVNNASDWGLVGAQTALAYCMSKGAVIQMTRCLALDHAQDQIRVNAVCPGDTFVERWTNDGYFRGSGSVAETVARHSADIPLGRVAEAGEIAKTVLFLACEQSSFITGVALPADGGNTAR